MDKYKKIINISCQIDYLRKCKEAAKGITASFGKKTWPGCWNDINDAGNLEKHEQLLKSRVCNDIQKKINELQEQLNSL